MIEASDREFALPELLTAADAQRLVGKLATLVGAPVCIVDITGFVLAGELPEAAANRAPLVLDIEPIGAVLSDASAERVTAVANLVQTLLRAQWRYRLAAALHQETVDEDFRRLLEKNTALEASEARYRALAEQLEQRVAEQVRTIETAQRQLYQAEKLASVGQLAAGMAHEINNPIGFIGSNLATAAGYVERFRKLASLVVYNPEPNLREFWRRADLEFVIEDFSQLIEESRSGVERIARIVADLKSFSSVDVPDRKPVDLNELIRRAANVAASSLGERIVVEYELGTLPLFECDAGQLGQVFLNFLLNAGEAIKGQGRVRFLSAVRAQQIEIQISDNGSGIPPDVLSRIFDPFFTTKDVGQGTGLGLTVCHDVVKAHGGNITVDTELGKGTTFIIMLPLTALPV